MPSSNTTTVQSVYNNEREMLGDDDVDSMLELMEDIDENKIGNARMKMELQAANLLKHVDKVIRASREAKTLTTKTSSTSTSKLVLKILRAAAIADSETSDPQQSRQHRDETSHSSQQSNMSSYNMTSHTVAKTRTNPPLSSLSLNGSIDFDEDDDGFECDMWSAGLQSLCSDEQKDNFFDNVPRVKSKYDKPSLRPKLFDDPFCLSSSQHTSKVMSFEHQQSLYLRDALVRCCNAAVSLQKNADLKISRLEIDNTYLRQQLAIEQSVNARLTITNLLLRRRLQRTMKLNQSTSTKQEKVCEQDASTVQLEKTIVNAEELKPKIFDDVDNLIEQEMNRILASRDHAIRESTETKKLLLSTCFECRQKLPIRGKNVPSKCYNSDGLRIIPVDVQPKSETLLSTQDVDSVGASSGDSCNLRASNGNTETSTITIDDGNDASNNIQKKISISTSFFVRKGMKDPLSTISPSLSSRKILQKTSSRQDLVSKCPPTSSTSSRNQNFQFPTSNELFSARTLSRTKSSSNLINTTTTALDRERARSNPRIRLDASSQLKTKMSRTSTAAENTNEKSVNKRHFMPATNLESSCVTNRENNTNSIKSSCRNDRVEFDMSRTGFDGNVQNSCSMNQHTLKRSDQVSCAINYAMASTSPTEHKLGVGKNSSNPKRTTQIEMSISNKLNGTEVVNCGQGEQLCRGVSLADRSRKLHCQTSDRPLRARIKRDDTGSWRQQFQASIFRPSDGDATTQ